MAQFNARDISWLSFNERVLQEAADPTVPLAMRIRFLGIYSNNLDEFFRVRVPAVKKAVEAAVGNPEKEDPLLNPAKVLEEINRIVIEHEDTFDKIWTGIQTEMEQKGVRIINYAELNGKQKEFVHRYFDEHVETNITPLILDEDRPMPYLRDDSLYLATSMWNKKDKKSKRYAIIEIPTAANGRFLILPGSSNGIQILLLEDVVIENLSYLFPYFGCNRCRAHCFKVTRDADFDLENYTQSELVEKLVKGLKKRRKGAPTRFVFDEDMNKGLLEFLLHKLKLTRQDSIIPGGRIHNFKDFMGFPNVFGEENTPEERKALRHPDLKKKKKRVTDVVLKKDVLLHFPYHSFDYVINLLREAAMDLDVTRIQVSAYRLASNSKIANALINAARNGKEVTVMLELRARFDEEANLYWKERFEDEGVHVLVGIPNKKVHGKLGVIEKKEGDKIIRYGFVSTGNLHEKTAKVYVDTMLMTANQTLMNDVNAIFDLLKAPAEEDPAEALSNMKQLLVSPKHMRAKISELIDFEMEEVRAGRPGRIIAKMNSLSDKKIIEKLYEAAEVGVDIQLIVRGIYCAVNQESFKKKIHTISIVDEYLEHSRIFYFLHQGKDIMYLSSADWMTRNFDHRIEAAAEIEDPALKEELKDLLEIYLKDNVKARDLSDNLENTYVPHTGERIRAQVEIYHYLREKRKAKEKQKKEG